MTLSPGYDSVRQAKPRCKFESASALFTEHSNRVCFALHMVCNVGTGKTIHDRCPVVGSLLRMPDQNRNSPLEQSSRAGVGRLQLRVAAAHRPAHGISPFGPEGVGRAGPSSTSTGITAGAASPFSQVSIPCATFPDGVRNRGPILVGNGEKAADGHRPNHIDRLHRGCDRQVRSVFRLRSIPSHFDHQAGYVGRRPCDVAGIGTGKAQRCGCRRNGQCDPRPS